MPARDIGGMMNCEDSEILFDEFVNSSDLTAGQKERMRHFRHHIKQGFSNGETALLMTLLDRAIERIDAVERYSIGLND